MVINPPPPSPVSALMSTSESMLGARAQPRHPAMKTAVQAKKHDLRPRASERRP